MDRMKQKCLFFLFAITSTGLFAQDMVTADSIQKPQFPGGKDSLTSFFNRNFKYEHESLCNYPSAVYVEFTVEEDGEITNIKYLRPFEHYTLYAETLRVLKCMPKWNPATQNGVAIKMSILLPIYLKW